MIDMLCAGIAKVDITNRGEQDLDDCPLSRQAEEHIPPQFRNSEIVIHDPLYVRALVLDDGERRIVIIVLDVTAVGCRTTTHGILADSAHDFVPRLRAEIKQRYQIAEDHVTVTATHTHPPRRLLCSDEEQIRRTLAAVGQAVACLKPVKIGVSTASEERLTFNRTVRLKDGTDETMRGCAPRLADDEIAELRPIDPEIGVLRIDAMDGSPVAVVYNFASHLLLPTPNGAISAGFPGVTSRYVEESIGGEVMAMFLQGACGDIAEVSKDDHEYGTPTSIERFGTTLGIGVMQCWRQAETQDATLQCISKTIDVPLRKDIPVRIEMLRREQLALIASLRYTNLNFKTFLPLYLQQHLHPDHPSHYAYRYRQEKSHRGSEYTEMDAQIKLGVGKYLESLRTMEQMARNEEKIGTLEKQQAVIDGLGGGTVSFEIQGIRIGNTAFVTAPAELLCEVGLNVKRSSSFPHTFVASFANGYLHYAPPASYYQGGGYEVTECLLDPSWERAFVETTQDILARLIRHPDPAAMH